MRNVIYSYVTIFVLAFALCSCGSEAPTDDEEICHGSYVIAKNSDVLLPANRGSDETQVDSNSLVDSASIFSGRLFALYPAGNDIIPDPVLECLVHTIPAEVRSKIWEITKPLINKYKEVGPLTGEVYELGLSNNNSLFIYKAEMWAGVSYYFIAYSKATKEVTVSAPEINGKWMQNDGEWHESVRRLLVKPMIQFRDIDGDSRDELIVRERAHNGNMYNAVVMHYYTLDRTMQLNELLAIEERSICLQDDIEGKECFIERTLVATGKNEWKLNVTHTCDGGSGAVAIGSLLLKRVNGVIAITGKKAIDERYESWLVTSSDVKEEQFLNEGYLFRY